MHTSTRAILLLSLVWLGMVLIVNPVGEFPLNDDWSYARAVYALVEHGRLEFTGWASVPLLAHVLWGTVFTLPGGFSFTALRVSVLVLGWVGIIGTFALLREVGSSVGMAWLAAMSLAVNPIYFALSFTFMTDVTFVSFAILACLFLMRALRVGSPADWVLGVLFACAATLTRQAGLAIPTAFLIAYLWQRGVRLATIWRALLPLLLVGGLLAGYQFWLQLTGRLPAMYFAVNDRLLAAILTLPQQRVTVVLRQLAVIALYMGLFLAPWGLAQVVHSFSLDREGPLPFFLYPLIWVGALGLLAGVLWFSDSLRPVLALEGHILQDFGIGPLTLRDALFLHLVRLPPAPGWVWGLVALLILLGLVFLGQALLWVWLSLWPRRAMRAQQAAAVFLLATSALYVAPLLLMRLWDRYLLFPLPLACALTSLARPRVDGAPMRRLAFAASGVVAALFAVFAVAATHDYLAWNRARWQALHDLTYGDGVAPTAIDGGFEFNGWHLYDPAYVPPRGKSWWWVAEDEYVITFGPLVGYEPVARYPYRRWLTFDEGTIHVLRRQAS